MWTLKCLEHYTASMENSIEETLARLSLDLDWSQVSIRQVTEGMPIILFQHEHQ